MDKNTALMLIAAMTASAGAQAVTITVEGSGTTSMDNNLNHRRGRAGGGKRARLFH